MEGHLKLNSKNLDSAFQSFIKSLKSMQTLESKYINELIYNICIVLLYKNEEKRINDFLNQTINIKDDQYLILLKGIEILVSNCRNNSKLLKYINSIEELENSHLSALAFKITTLIYMKLENYEEAKETIKKSQEMLKTSSGNISDFYQRKLFLERVYINRDIMATI